MTLFLSYCWQTTLAQTVLKLDTANNVQGVGFDVPIKLQISLNRNAHIFNVSYYEVPQPAYRHHLDVVTGYKDKGPSDRSYYIDALKYPHRSILLSKRDVLLPVTTGGQTSYQMTLVHPVYFKPNKHYVIALFTALVDDSNYGPSLAGVMEYFLKARQALVAANIPLPSIEDSLYIADTAQRYDPSLQQDWTAIKATYATNANADTLLTKGISLYNQLSDQVYQANHFSGLPLLDGDLTPKIPPFWCVYAAIKPLRPIYDGYIKVQQTNLNFPGFSGNDCLYKLMQQELSCTSCNPTLAEQGFLRDTTGFYAFLNDLQQPQGASVTTSLINRLIDSVKIGALLSPASKQDDQQLQTIRLQVLRLQTITSYKSLHPANKCDSVLAAQVNAAAATLDALIKARATIAKLQTQFLEQLTSNTDFLTVTFYNADTYVYDLNTRYGFRLTADLGLVDYGFVPGYAYGLGQVTPYAGVNFNFQYVQSNIPFASIPGNKWYSLRHWSAMLGMSLLSVKKAGKFDNLFNKNAVLIGAGYRIIQEIRLVSGVMFVKKDNPNPLIGTTTTAVIPYFGVSFDTNTILQGITKFF